MSVNKFVGLGNVGLDPQINYTSDGKAIANFSLGMSETWNDKTSGEKKQKTEWIKVIAFGNLANVVQAYVKKGSKVYVEGSLQTRKWTDKNGAERYTTEVILQGYNSNLQFLDSKNKEERDEDKTIDQHSIDKGNDFQSEQENDDEIPF
jgi:single-strand DNA-binding protein